MNLSLGVTDQIIENTMRREQGENISLNSETFRSWLVFAFYFVILVVSCDRHNEEICKDNLLNEICELYARMAKNNEVRDKFRVLINTETLEYVLDTLKPLNANEWEILDQMTSSELNQIVFSDTFLRKDLSKNVVIIDTTSFFNRSDVFDIEEKHFRIEHSNLDCPKEVVCLVLHAHRILKDKADFHFVTSNEDLSLTFSFDITNELKITNSRLIVRRTDRPIHLQ